MISYGARGPEQDARDQLKSGADYITSAVWWSPQMMQSDQSAKFISRFRARYGRTPEWYEALGYEAARALLEAVHKAGSTDPDAVRVALESLRMDSILPSSTLTFPEQYGRQAQYLFVVQQNMPDGSSPIVYPKIAAVKEGISPNPRCAPAKTADAR
jgi:branched-chain amino acid transport system substrate-binding protein